MNRDKENAVHFTDTETLIRSDIHPSATIHGGVEVTDDIVVGSRAVIDRNAKVSGRIGDFSTVGHEAIVEGSSLGTEVGIEPYAEIQDSSIGYLSRVGSYAEVKSSKIGDLTDIGRYAKVESSRIGNMATVGGGAILEKDSRVAGKATVAGSETVPSNVVRI